jgi:hypothetical protein
MVNESNEKKYAPEYVRKVFCSQNLQKIEVSAELEWTPLANDQRLRMGKGHPLARPGE